MKFRWRVFSERKHENLDNRLDMQIMAVSSGDFTLKFPEEKPINHIVRHENQMEKKSLSKVIREYFLKSLVYCGLKLGRKPVKFIAEHPAFRFLSRKTVFIFELPECSSDRFVFDR